MSDSARPRYLANVSWLTVDHLLRLGLSFAVNIWVVRYLGAEQYGLLSYALGLVALVSPFTVLGMDGILVRELARSDAEPQVLLGTAFALKLAGGVIAILLVLLDLRLLSLEGAAPLAMVAVLSSLFQGLGVIDLYFQSQVASRFVVVARQVQTWLGALLRIALVQVEAPLIWFVWLVVVEAMVLGMGLIVAYGLHGGGRRWRFERTVAGRLLREGWPLFVSGLALTIQARIGLVLLGRFAGAAEVAQYAVAVRLVELFAFVPDVMRKTFAPALTWAKERGEEEFLAYLTDLHRLMFWLGILIAVPVVLFGHWLVPWIYGDQFTAAGLLLTLSALRIPMMMVRPVRRLFIINQELSFYALISALIGVCISIALNLWLISCCQALGAVVAQLLSAFVALILIDLFHGPARVNLRALGEAVVTPLHLRSIRRLLVH